MSHDWMIDALAELKAHAEQHSLSALAAQLEIAMQIAHLELAQQEDGAGGDTSSQHE